MKKYTATVNLPEEFLSYKGLGYSNGDGFASVSMIELQGKTIIVREWPKTIQNNTHYEQVCDDSSYSWIWHTAWLKDIEEIKEGETVTVPSREAFIATVSESTPSSKNEIIKHLEALRDQYITKVETIKECINHIK